jgi:hypothetical protein
VAQRRTLDGHLANAGCVGRVAYRRVRNPGTGITNERWEAQGAGALISSTLRSLGVEVSAAHWADVCAALAVPGLETVWRTRDGVRVRVCLQTCGGVCVCVCACADSRRGACNDVRRYVCIVCDDTACLPACMALY